ncbi:MULTISPECIES: LysR family transcriptional regulator [unclassified Acidovorax]|uniref:LysR family transcriptional regulator n=1 Tax=unclassified Acidovorax TaxID=2684926 RepID=UPI002882DA3D|nr:MULTISPECIES: LysR family transcriptional regulator [unclassified Acidovorax]
MNLRFVEAFYWVASLKSVTRAAEKLFLTQSAMSSRIAALEEELGVLLLDRRDKHFKLTVAGSRFLIYAKRMLELQRQLKTEMGSGGPVEMSMRLGAIESVLHSWLIPWIEQLRKDNPLLNLELTVETTPVLLDQMRRGTLDVAFAALPASADGIRNQALTPMEMVFVGNGNIHRKRRYVLGDFADTDILTFQRGSQPHVYLLDTFRHAQVEPRRVHTVSSISAMVQLVQGGFGVATLPRLAVARLLAFPDLRALSCDAALKPLPIHVSYREDPSSPAMENIVRSALDFIDNMQPLPKNRTGSTVQAARQGTKKAG